MLKRFFILSQLLMAVVIVCFGTKPSKNNQIDYISLMNSSPKLADCGLKALASFPKLSQGEPAKGKKVAVTEPEYEGTKVRHLIYLPENYDKKKKYPLIVEYTGNKWGYGSGEVEEAHLGYSITLGRDFIWVVLPYVAADHRHNEVTWWGDANATANYASMVIPRIIEKYNGDKDNVVLCGFSRGSIGASLIGLRNDNVASLWSAFITHDHFDGQKEWGGNDWGSPLAKYRKEAAERLQRAKGKPWYLSCNKDTEDYSDIIEEMGVDKVIDFTYCNVPISKRFPEIPNDYFVHSHNDVWALFDIEESRALRKWLYDVCKIQKLELP